MGAEETALRGAEGDREGSRRRGAGKVRARIPGQRTAVGGDALPRDSGAGAGCRASPGERPGRARRRRQRRRWRSRAAAAPPPPAGGRQRWRGEVALKGAGAPRVREDERSLARSGTTVAEAPLGEGKAGGVS